MTQIVEYGVLDDKNELVLLPGPDSYLKTTVKDLGWLQNMFGSHARIVKVTIEDIPKNQETSPA